MEKQVTGSGEGDAAPTIHVAANENGVGHHGY